MKISYEIPENKNDLTLRQYVDIIKHIENDDMMSMVASALKLDVGIVNKFPPNEYNEIKNTIIDIFNKDVDTMYMTFNLKGVRMGFIPNLEKITIGEFSELSKLLEKPEGKEDKIASVLFRPIIKEKKISFFKRDKAYNIIPYDNEIDTGLYWEMPAGIYESSLLFFYNLGMILSNVTLKYTMEKVETKELNGSGENGDGINHMTLTHRQKGLGLKKYIKNLQVKYCYDYHMKAIK